MYEELGRTDKESKQAKHFEDALEWRIRNALLNKSFDELREIGTLKWTKYRDFRKAWAFYTTAIIISKGCDTKSLCNRAVIAYTTFVDPVTGEANLESNETLQALFDGYYSAKSAYDVDPSYTKAVIYLSRIGMTLKCLDKDDQVRFDMALHQTFDKLKSMSCKMVVF